MLIHHLMIQKILEEKGELKRILLPVNPDLEITEIADRTLRSGGPALLFENPVGPFYEF